MLNRLSFHPFLQVSQIFQRRQSDANKQDFENTFNLTCQAQSTPKTIGILIKVFCTSGPNLVVLAWTGDELLHGQAQNRVNFDFEGKFDLEGKGQSPLKTIGILTKVFYTCVSNLVIPVSVMVMNDLLPPPLCNVNRPSHSEIQLIQNLTLKIHGQCHVCGQRSRSHLTFNMQRSR